MGPSFLGLSLAFFFFSYISLWVYYKTDVISTFIYFDLALGYPSRHITSNKPSCASIAATRLFLFDNLKPHDLEKQYRQEYRCVCLARTFTTLIIKYMTQSTIIFHH